MKIKLHILNYSKVIPNEICKSYIENLLRELSTRGVNSNNINFELNNVKLYEIIEGIIDQNSNSQALINNLDLRIIANEYWNNDERLVIIGEDVPTEFPWGDAIPGFFTIVKYVIEKNIWHEVIHVLGVDDHYDGNTLEATDNCLGNECIMQYGKIDGTLCDNVIKDIKFFIN